MLRNVFYGCLGGRNEMSCPELGRLTREDALHNPGKVVLAKTALTGPYYPGVGVYQLTQLVAPTILKAIDDAMDREYALGALVGWAKVTGPRKAKSPNNPNAN